MIKKAVKLREGWRKKVFTWTKFWLKGTVFLRALKCTNCCFQFWLFNVLVWFLMDSLFPLLLLLSSTEVPIGWGCCRNYFISIYLDVCLRSSLNWCDRCLDFPNDSVTVLNLHYVMQFQATVMFLDGCVLGLCSNLQNILQIFILKKPFWVKVVSASLFYKLG